MISKVADHTKGFRNYQWYGPFSTALTGDLLRQPSRMWSTELRSGHPALHPASTVNNGTLAIYAPPSKA